MAGAIEQQRLRWPEGSCEMAVRMRDHDWSATPLGPVEGWPEQLRILTEVMLAATQPMFVTWGPARITLYNDAYAAILADKHPALGLPFERMWPEIWKPDLEKIVARAYAGEALHMSDITLKMQRNGALRDAHFSFSYTPLRDAEGRVQGFFCPCLEITDAILGERRLRFREMLAEHLRKTDDPELIAFESAGLLARHLRAEQAAYAVIDPKAGNAVIHRDWNDGTLPSTAGVHRLRDFSPALIADLLAGHHVAVGDVSRDPRTSAPGSRRTFATRGIAAFLNIPHLRNGRLVGVLALHSATPRDWQPSDISLALEVAERVNSAMERAAAERSLRESEAQLRQSEERHAFLLKLSDATRDLRSAKDVMRAAANVLGPRLGVTLAGFSEIDDSGSIRTEGEYNAHGGASVFSGQSFPMESFGRTTADALRQGQPVMVTDVLTTAQLDRQEKSAVAAVGIRSFIACPILASGRLAALLFAACDTPRPWSQPEVALLRETAERSFSAVLRARAEAALVESESRLRALVHSTSDLAFRVSADWSRLDLLDENGIPRNAAPEGMDWIETAIPPEDRTALRTALAEAVATRSPIDLEHKVLRDGNASAWVRMRAVPILDASGEIREWFGASIDITESKRFEQSQQLLLAELDHRVKNILAVVQAIAQQTLGTGKGSLPDDARRLIGRIAALAESHRLLARSSWDGARLRDLVHGAVAPHRGAHPGRLSLSGPDIHVNPRAAQTMMLALHELATNAAKYGALSLPDGLLDVSWTVTPDDGDPRLVISWQERQGPPIKAPPVRRGFGSTLIEQTLAFELDGRACLDFAPDGLRAAFDLPLGNLVRRAAPARPAPQPPDNPASSADVSLLKGKRILVVEDEHLVAQDTVLILHNAGCEIIGPVPNVAAALHATETSRPDAAILDINLSREFVWPAALRLQALGTPFVFVTGYASPVDIPSEVATVTRLEKPLRADCLVQGLAEAFAAAKP